MSLTDIRLLQKPHPFEGESLKGYFLRLAEVNEVQTPSWIAIRSIGLYRRNFGEVGLAEYRLITGHPAEMYARFPLQWRDETVHPHYSYRGLCLPPFLYVYPRARVCPLCIREGRFLPAEWELACVVACRRHRVLLIDHCPECGRGLIWVRKRMGLCLCKASLGGSETTLAHPDAFLMQEYLLAALDGRPEEVLPEGWPALDHPEAVRLLGRMMDLYIRLLYKRHNSTVTTSTRTVAERVEMLRMVWTLAGISPQLKADLLEMRADVGESIRIVRGPSRK